MNRFHNLEDFRQRAKTRLPKIMFDFIDGAAGGENGSYNNYHCIERIRLLPRVLNNVVERDLTKPVFEEEYKLPFGIAPMGMCNTTWPGADQILAAEAAHRRIPVQYGRSIFRSGRVYRQAGASYLPIRVNSAGVIPLIFAFSVVILPGTVATFLADSSGFVGDVGAFFARAFSPGAFFYWVLTFILVVAFTFFFTIVTFQQQALAENLQKSGGFVTGIRPGRPTQDYLNRVILRLTVGGALFLGFIAVIPFLASSFTNLQALQLSSTSLLILVFSYCFLLCFFIAQWFVC